MFVEPPDAVGQARDIIRILQDQAIHAIGHHLGGPVRRRGNHRQAAGHGFGGRLRERVFERRANIHIRGGVIPLHVRARGAEFYFSFQSQLANPVLVRSRVIFARHDENEGKLAGEPALRSVRPAPSSSSRCPHHKNELVLPEAELCANFRTIAQPQLAIKNVLVESNVDDRQRPLDSIVALQISPRSFSRSGSGRYSDSCTSGFPEK